MKKISNSVLAGSIISLLIFFCSPARGQSDKKVIEKYLGELPSLKDDKKLCKYRMTAVYTNRDLYGNFTGKTKVTGDYTRGLEDGTVFWKNVYISGSDRLSDPFPEGTRQEYMENYRYTPSPEMLNPNAYKNFPAGVETVLAKNLIWDMMSIELFAWDYKDSLKVGRIYIIPEIKGEFSMADIGTYSHNEIQLCWTGISVKNNELCGIIEFRALDNKIELDVDPIKTRGTEQYWGTIWISLTTGLIEYSEMYGGTIQEIEITGMENKILAKTIRELWVDKIK